uniref:PRKCA-binding protein n=1 Tax=Aceria tosichella TaxID=561515 RepID=A0A6G1S8F3_9ACAR
MTHFPDFNQHFSGMYDPSLYSDMLGPLQEDRLGMTVTSGQVKITKDQSNLIGISIGGGAPHCPCLYIIQIFDNTPAALEGTLEPGDELTAINGVSVKGSTRTEAAQAIQQSKDHVIINYNKLHADTNKAKSLDIVLKKLKHRLTENISPSTADAFGLSRAILCNDTLVKRLEELERNELMYSEIRERTRNTFKAFYELNHIYKEFGDVFTEIGCREKQPEAGEAFRRFGETHRLFEKYGLEMLNSIRTMLGNLDTFISKAIPDTKLTIKKYEDVKFEYLSYCLKVKEMDDEEKDYYSMHEPLFRVETGNYEYRLVLRCRQAARRKFSQLRTDVTQKIELLDQKHVQHLSSQLQTMVSALAQYNSVCIKLFSNCIRFPLDMDLSQCFDFNYTDEQDLTEENDELSSLNQTSTSNNNNNNDNNNTITSRKNKRQADSKDLMEETEPEPEKDNNDEIIKLDDDEGEKEEANKIEQPSSLLLDD